MPKGETFYCFVYSQQSLNNEKIFSLYGNVEIRRQCFIFFYVNWINFYSSCCFSDKNSEVS